MSNSGVDRFFTILVHLGTNPALPIFLICHATCQTIKLLQEVAKIRNFLEISFIFMDLFFKISHEISLWKTNCRHNLISLLITWLPYNLRKNLAERKHKCVQEEMAISFMILTQKIRNFLEISFIFMDLFFRISHEISLLEMNWVLN